MLGVPSSAYLFTSVLVLASVARAQNNASTDPSEASALNSIFAQWDIKANTEQWNTTGDPCTGAAIDDSVTIDDSSHNPFIKCQCTFNSSSICRIIALRVFAMDVAGPIPEELWTLRFLTSLNLAQNYLTGSLSPSIGNLTRMQYLSLGINAISGEIPKELGQLTDLRALALLSNNFAGPLPLELGNLLKLEQLYIDSSGVSGQIPSTFANLQNLRYLWASDTNLTGRIPDFVGNWSKLEVLRLHGNSFEGPIPSTFVNLVSMKNLHLGEISNASSSLSFITNMRSLVNLILRNNNISDSLPSSLGEYSDLTFLDLSFNNIHGHIPDSLFDMPSLYSLILGNNTLGGSLPQKKNTSLLNIDLSYNNLEGSLPTWVNQPNLQLNLVGNNFKIKSLKNSALPSGLNCLQRDFPCSRGRPIYYNFAINCGGPQITSSYDIVYESDNETLGPATYFVANNNRWAVSTAGYFIFHKNATYITSSLSHFTSTLDSALFQDARISPSSLRYYGLGLQNGNYTVNLQFAETAFEDSSSWRKVGKRIFDIYIQGKRVSQDLNIRKETGGVSSPVVQLEFNAQVTENYLEIHLFWAGKGTCCIPVQGTYGPSISAIRATPAFMPTVGNLPPTSKKSKINLIVGISVGVGALIFLFVAAISYIVRRRRKKLQISEDEDDELVGMDLRPFTFSFVELKTATNDFDSANKLGEGGFGPVYKGTLDDGRVIAVKRLSLTSHQGKNQFVTEIATISAVQHRNLVKLYGCCLEGDKRLLVYEYLENKSLDHALFGKDSLKLNWPTRFDICLGIARGLAYLHEESRVRIVHRDVKASNILLDSDLVPKISDFGLAKFYDDKKTHISTCIAGTFGYLAPEYAMSGHLTEKADVFAFGIVALEVVSGRPPTDMTLEEENRYLLEWAWNLHEQKCELTLMDSELSEFDADEARRVIRVALLCTQTSPLARPSMSRVVAMLSGDAEVSNEISRPGYFANWKFDDTSSLMIGAEADRSETIFDFSSEGINMTKDVGLSPRNACLPMLDSTVRG